MDRRKLIPVLAVVLMLMMVSPVFADYYDGFDSYPTTTASPATPGNPWTWTPAATYTSCFTGTFVSDNNPPGGYTAPNYYQFTTIGSGTNATCTGATPIGTFSLKINTTSPSVSVSFQLIQITSSSSTLTVTLCGTAVYTTTAFSAIANTWTVKSGAAPTASNCKLSFNVQVENTAASGKIGIDNVVVKGGNAINANANLFLIDGRNGNWFNITGYKNSYVKVSFRSNPPLYYNLTAPDINVTLTSGSQKANLLTVYVDANYWVSIIPTTTHGAKNYVYLWPPNQEFTYILEVQDLSSKFGPGTKIVVQGGHTLFGGYEDSDGNFPVWIVPGLNYNVTLTNGVNVFHTTANFPSIQGTLIPIQILKFSTSGSCSSSCTVTYNAGFNSALDHIVVVFNDTTDTTTSITDTVYNQNASGIFIVYTHTWSPGPWGAFQDSIACHTGNCNATIASQLSVVLAFSNTFGFETNQIPVSASGLFGSTFAGLASALNNFLDWNYYFQSSPTTWTAFFAYIIVLMTAVSSGAFVSRFMGLVTGAIASALILAGWLPLNPILIPFIMGVGVLQWIAFMESGR